MAFAAELLAWFDAARRDLPWRRTRDPWAIWVSEVMLQQTRVEAVRDAWARFVQAWPTPAAFAAASDDELQAAWRGLGYYRRARLLRDGARAVVARHDGEVPGDAEALGALPGVGPYTAGAVASIAFALPELAIDGNVERVVARRLALRANVKQAAGRAAIADAVRGWQPRQRPGDFNQALMELGALVCTPQAPACDRCPVRTGCRGRAEGVAERLPVRPAPVRAVEVAAAVAVATVRGGVLAYRIAEGEINAGQLELPGPGALVSVDGPRELANALRARFDAVLEIGQAVAHVRHAITKHRIRCAVHVASARRRGRLLVATPFAPDVPWSTISRKALRAALAPGVGA